MSKTTLPWFLFLALLFPGCAGYQLGAVKPSAYEKVDRVFVPPFKNNTLEPRISNLVTNAVLKQMQVDGTYKVSTRSKCDAILEGTIERIHKYQLRGLRTDTIRSQELGLYLYIKWRLVDPDTGQEIARHCDSYKEPETVIYGDESVTVSPGTVVGDTIQFVDASFQVGERNALAVAAEDAAKKLIDQMSEGW